jgi:hypothetical protein
MQHVAALTVAVATGLAGCGGVPQFVLMQDKTPIGGAGQQSTVSDAARVGPKVASLVANLKCELWKAANSTKTLPYYNNDSDNLYTRNRTEDPKRTYNLKNLFSEIQYVAQATFNLDVIEVGALNPSLTYTDPVKGAVGLLPATSHVLAVTGTISETPHRYIQFNQAIDFGRLVEAAAPDSLEIATPLANMPKLGFNCGSDSGGSELQGNLGLEEILATGMIAASMSDISVFPTSASAKGSVLNAGMEPITVSSNNVFGLISAQIDFTVVRSLGLGATWNLRYLKGPGGPNLLTLNRQVKDTVLITFVPVCIRRRPDYEKPDESGRYEYTQPFPMVEGTPGWANYLGPCTSAKVTKDKADAVLRGKSTNELLQLIVR